MGYTDVASMTGGFQRWKTEGLDWTAPPVLTAEQKQRYSRHLLIPEVGLEGQARLLDSKVLLIGAGGLGAPAALYLAAAGVGTIGIVDFDVVDLSNLQRQVIHANDRIGEKKVDSARARRSRPSTRTSRSSRYEEMLVADNVERIIAGYDVILDGTDTFETRYLLNDAAVAAGIPVVHASVFRFEGQLTVFEPFEGPCYRCLYPTPAAARARARLLRRRRPRRRARDHGPAPGQRGRSSCCSASATRSPAGCSCSTPWTRRSASSGSAATRPARSARTRRRGARGRPAAAVARSPTAVRSPSAGPGSTAQS